MAESRISRYVARLQQLEQKKQPWLPLYQRLAEVYLGRRVDFTRAAIDGEFLEGEIFDDTPAHAASTFASVCLSLLWPDAARTFRVVPAAFLKNKPGVEAYFKRVTARLQSSMDRSESGLHLALTEHFYDSGVFGICGVASLENVEDDHSVPVTYETWDAKTMFVSENARGHVDTVYLKLEMTVRQVMQEYGSGKKPGDKVAARVKEAYDNNRLDEKVEVVKVLEPKEAIKDKRGYHAMPWRSCHIDPKNKTIMRESGFEELPVAIGRALKRAGETQGRSFGMLALATSVNLNNLGEGIIAATEKNLEPPLGVLDDGRLGGTVVDDSAGGITVINTAGRPFGEKPIFPLYTVGEMQSSKDLREQFIESVMRSFLLDKLLELGGDRPMMTAYETAVRNRIRGESTGMFFARQIIEVLIPTIKRTFNIHYRKGYLGDFPGIPSDAPGVVQRRLWKEVGGDDDMIVPEIVKKAVAAGLDVYDIEFISPAARFMQAEKLNGLMTSMDAKLAVAAMRPDILDGTDLDDWARLIDQLSGSPLDAQRTKEKIAEVRQAAAERQNAAATLEAGGMMADIQAKSAQARAAMGTVAK